MESDQGLCHRAHGRHSLPAIARYPPSGHVSAYITSHIRLLLCYCHRLSLGYAVPLDHLLHTVAVMLSLSSGDVTCSVLTMLTRKPHVIAGLSHAT